MAYGMNRFATATATGVIDEGSGILYSVGVCAGVDAATVVVRTGGAGGTIICKLGVAAGLSAQRTFVCGVAYNADLHVTVTGTTPQVDVEV